MRDVLLVYLGDHQVGHLKRSRNGRIEFEYDGAWLSRKDAYPLSLSMPLTAQHHPPKTVEPYLWGLLPDNDTILERWARRYQVSPRSAFALLRHVGEDCPGAVRLLRPEQAQGANNDGMVWLKQADIAQRLRALRTDASAWRTLADAGQFSLAGAQPKTALWFNGRRWGLPTGRTPTTHILKPGILDLDRSAHNEHYCLNLARELGLPVARSRIMRFEDEIGIVVERYDRLMTGNNAARAHQEDVCQALSVHPANKYENEGGPGVTTIVRLLRETSSRNTIDIETFVSAIAFNWLIAGTDAHAKNYSLLIGTGGKVRLAPLYDLASALPYPDMPFQKLKLAMKISGRYRVRDIGRYQWKKLTDELTIQGVNPLTIARRLAEALPQASTSVVGQLQAEGLKHDVVPSMHRKLCERAMQCAAQLGSGSPG